MQQLIREKKFIHFYVPEMPRTRSGNTRQKFSLVLIKIFREEHLLKIGQKQLKDGKTLFRINIFKTLLSTSLPDCIDR
ncbi:MAG: hypothetical protein CM1200mP30_27010 [Pseudomonadota bacterium]|nr:MAG: hypothetical protein CM1200mP30_27010 [Pseudomonadota bacterium]